MYSPAAHNLVKKLEKKTLEMNKSFRCKVIYRVIKLIFDLGIFTGILHCIHNLKLGILLYLCLQLFTYNMVHLISCHIQSPIFGEIVDCMIVRAYNHYTVFTVQIQYFYRDSPARYDCEHGLKALRNLRKL
jgi:hypothetical protein